MLLLKTSLDVEIISGEKEAKLSALGLMYGIDDAKGIVADLGGGSLEIASVANNKVDKVISLALGLKAQDFSNNPCTEEEASALISQYGESKKISNLYLIGGAFRILSRYYMYELKYPLRNLHQFTVECHLFLGYLKKLEGELYTQNYYQSKINAHAIVILRGLIKHFSPDNIIISNYGLKEGIFFSHIKDFDSQPKVVYQQLSILTRFDKTAINLDAYRNIFKYLMIEYDQDIEDYVDMSIMLLKNCRYIDHTMQDSYLINLISTCSIPFSHKTRVSLINIIAGIFGYRISRNTFALSCKMLSKKEYHVICIIVAVLKIALIVDGQELITPHFKLHISDEDFISFESDFACPKVINMKINRLVQEIGKLRKKIKYNT
jgi:exopolyphosphatase/guanosine-5'-triphosphate,3'-diphosphate pyrophosphatase